jgi:hypothetical protein
VRSTGYFGLQMALFFRGSGPAMPAGMQLLDEAKSVYGRYLNQPEVIPPP